MLIWIGDLITLLWFCHYFVKHFLLKEPFEPIVRPPSQLLPVTSLALAWVVDLTITLGTMYREKEAHTTAEEVAGRVTTVQKKEFPACVKYDLDCEFMDKQGQLYSCRFTIRNDRKEGWPPGLPAPLAESMQAGQVPFPASVLYDADQPSRSWIAGIGWHDGERLYYFSLLPLIFQVFFLPLFLSILFERVRQEGQWPWWYDLYKVVPFFVEVGVFLLFGLLEFYVQARQ
jgi:hypothetical protein